MEITLENLHRAIAALRQCANENAGKPTDTGNVVVAGLCTDVADFLEKQFDIKNRNVRMEVVWNRCRLDKREYPTEEERSRVGQKRMLLDLIGTRMIETKEADDFLDESGNTIIVQSQMYIGVKKGIDLDKELAHEEH
jgi:hypothetical protein